MRRHKLGQRSDVAQSLGSIPNNSFKRNRPSVRSLALSLQSIETDITPHEALIQQQTCELLASEIDIEIEEQFESICCESESTVDNPEKKDKEPPQFSSLETQIAKRKLLSTSATFTDSFSTDSHHLQRAKSLPKRNTTLSTFWKLVDKHNLKPLEPTWYLPDTNNLDSLQSRLKSGGIEFEELKELSKAPEGISKSTDLLQKESNRPVTFLQEVSPQKVVLHNPVFNIVRSNDEILQSYNPLYLVGKMMHSQ